MDNGRAQWKRSYRSFFALAPLIPLFAGLSGCSDHEEDVGRAVLALMQVPNDLRCVRLTATGSRTTVRSFAVTAGQSSSFQMTGLSLGTVRFLGEGFTAACSQLAASAVPAWISEPVSAAVDGTSNTDVTLILRRNGRATVGVDFQDEPLCRAESQPCATDAECCRDLACLAGVDGALSCKPTAGRTLLFALMLDRAVPDPFAPPPDSAVEVVDLTSLSRVRTVATGQRKISSLAVSPDGARLYLADQTNRQFAVLDAVTGALLASIPVTGARDLVLSPSGTTLYADTPDSLLAIDTASNAITSSLAIGTDVPKGLALSADGTRLGAAVGVGSPAPAFLLVSTTGPLTLLRRIAIVGSGCEPVPDDAVFTNSGRALLWDSHCDAIYQVDVAAMSQLTAGTILGPRDSAALFNYNIMTFSESASRVYTLKESHELFVGDPAAVTHSIFGGFSGLPTAIAQSLGGDVQYIAVMTSAGGANTLDRFDTAAQTFQRGVYTFSDPAKRARDMHIVRVAR